MSAARDQIIAGVRSALLGADGRGADAAAVKRDAAALLADIDPVRPRLSHADVVQSFAARVVGPKVNATLDRVASFSDVPSVVSAYLAGRGLDARIALLPQAQVTGLGWRDGGVDVVADASEGVLVAMARWAVAETGSVLFHSAADVPILPNFLAATQIIVVPSDVIVAYLEDYSELARAAGDPAPRNVCFVTGASGTSDIEGSYVKGAHGPRDIHIVIVG